MNNNFIGFNEETLNFFIDIKDNNNRTWFAENKSRYEKYVKETSLLFIEHIACLFAEVGLPFVADTKKSLFRIYRDIRFSSNKNPYKTHLGIFFPYISSILDRKPINSFGIYFHIEPEMYFLSAGIYQPEPSILKDIRERISEDYPRFKDILKSNNFSAIFPDGIDGEKLKKAPKGFDIDHPAIDYLKLKEFSAFLPLTKSEVTNSSISEYIIKVEIAILPLLEFLDGAINKTNGQ